MAFRGYGGGTALSADERLPNSRRGQLGTNSSKSAYFGQMSGADKKAALIEKMKKRSAEKKAEASAESAPEEPAE